MENHEHIQKHDSHPYYKLIVFDERTDQRDHCVPKHWHNHLELTACTGGSSSIWVDGAEHVNTPGHVFAINSRSVHSIQSNEPLPEAKGFCLQINLNLFASMMPFLQNIRFEEKCSDEVSRFIIEKETELLMLQHQQDTFFQQIEITLAILRQLYENHQNLESPQKYPQLFYDILDYVHDNFREPLSSDDVASCFHISTGHLNRLFRIYLKQSLHSLLMDLRVDAAVNDILATDLKLIDIYLKNGFPSNKSFIAEFRKRLNMTPSQYRLEIASR